MDRELEEEQLRVYLAQKEQMRIKKKEEIMQKERAVLEELQQQELRRNNQ